MLILKKWLNQTMSPQTEQSNQRDKPFMETTKWSLGKSAFRFCRATSWAVEFHCTPTTITSIEWCIKELRDMFNKLSVSPLLLISDNNSQFTFQRFKTFL